MSWDYIVTVPEFTGDKEAKIIRKPKTNYDRIRSMSSVEELATFLFHAWNNASWCSAKDCPDEDSCLPCWIDWLKKECES